MYPNTRRLRRKSAQNMESNGFEEVDGFVKKREARGSDGEQTEGKTKGHKLKIGWLCQT